jgi:hypothetical protein
LPTDVVAFDGCRIASHDLKPRLLAIAPEADVQTVESTGRNM